eukprot:3666131-Alexandrium_andersonii.AAC.1
MVDPHSGALRVFALCQCKKHKERCSRSRAWTSDREVPDHVERVLAHWLIVQDLYGSTHARVKEAPRH